MIQSRVSFLSLLFAAMHVGGVIISHRKLGAFSRFPIERHLFLDPLTQTQSLIPSVIT